MRRRKPTITPLAINVRNIRDSKRVSQSALSVGANVGLTTLERLECGYGVNVETVRKIAKFLDVPVSELFKGE